LNSLNIFIFVAAAVFNSLPILVIYKVHINKIMKDPRSYSAIQRSFFIGAAMSKIIPIILLIFGIIKMSSVESANEIIVPVAVVIAFIIIPVIYILKQRSGDYPADVKQGVRTLSTITLPHVFSVPIMALVFIFLML